MEERERIYNKLMVNPNDAADMNDPDVRKALEYIIADRKAPKEPKEQCLICNKHTLKQCYRCRYYFCDEHVDTDRWGDFWCKECDECISKGYL